MIRQMPMLSECKRSLTFPQSAVGIHEDAEFQDTLPRKIDVRRCTKNNAQRAIDDEINSGAQPEKYLHSPWTFTKR